MEISLLLIRCVLSVVLLVAGIAKLLDRRGFRKALTDLGLKGTLSGSVASILPLVEVAIAITLLPARTAAAGALSATALFGVFTVGVGFFYLRGRRTECRCFGRLASAPIGSATLFRNFLFTSLALLLVWQSGPAGRLSLFAWLDTSAGAGPETWAAGVGTLLIALGVGFALVRLLPRPAEASREASATTTVQSDAATPATGLQVGSRAPEFVLEDLSQRQISLEDLVQRGRPTMLLFTSPGCDVCQSLLGDIERWDRELQDRLTIAVINSAGLGDSVVQFEGRRIGRVLVNGMTLGDQYRVEVAPSAVLIDVDGMVASRHADGSAAIRELVRSLVE